MMVEGKGQESDLFSSHVNKIFSINLVKQDDKVVCAWVTYDCILVGQYPVKSECIDLILLKLSNSLVLFESIGSLYVLAWVRLASVSSSLQNTSFRIVAKSGMVP